MPGEAKTTNTYPAALGMKLTCILSTEFELLATTNSPHKAEEGEQSAPSTPVPPSYLIQATFELRQS